MKNIPGGKWLVTSCLAAFATQGQAMAQPVDPLTKLALSNPQHMQGPYSARQSTKVFKMTGGQVRNGPLKTSLYDLRIYSLKDVNHNRRSGGY